MGVNTLLHDGWPATSAHFEYEADLQYSPQITTHIIAAILHKAHSKRQVYYWQGMKHTDFYNANTDFMKLFALAFKEKRDFELNYNVIKDGIIDFIERMEYVAGK